MWSFGANNKPDTFLDLRQLGTNPTTAMKPCEDHRLINSTLHDGKVIHYCDVMIKECSIQIEGSPYHH